MIKHAFTVPDNRKIRVIIDTDAGCEADDQYAIAHALMSAKVEVTGLIAEHFGHLPGSMQSSVREIRKICSLMHCEEVPVLEGADHAMEHETLPESSPGSRFLAEMAQAEDRRPLFVLCQGALTNVASAILEFPDIQERIQIVMVGGTNYPAGGYEFNTMNDPAAFNAVMNSKASVWVLPEEVYATMQTGLMELKEKAACCGELGQYLYEKTLETVRSMAEAIPAVPGMSAFEQALSFPNGESWSLGDSAGIGLLLMHHAGSWELAAAPNVTEHGQYQIPDRNRKVRWYTGINQRFILEDFFAKIQYYFG